MTKAVRPEDGAVFEVIRADHPAADARICVVRKPGICLRFLVNGQRLLQLSMSVPFGKLVSQANWQWEAQLLWPEKSVVASYQIDGTGREDHLDNCLSLVGGCSKDMNASPHIRLLRETIVRPQAQIVNSYDEEDE